MKFESLEKSKLTVVFRVCEQKHASGQEGHGVQRPLHVLVRDFVQRPPTSAAGPRKPPERPHLLLITHTHILRHRHTHTGTEE